MHKAVHWRDKTPATPTLWRTSSFHPESPSAHQTHSCFYTHFNQPGHSIDHLLLTPLELIHSKRDSVRKAREAHLINKAMTLQPLGINRRDEEN